MIFVIKKFCSTFEIVFLRFQSLVRAYCVALSSSLAAVNATVFTMKRRTLIELLKFCSDNYWYNEENENYTRALRKVDKSSFYIMAIFFMSGILSVLASLTCALVGNVFFYYYQKRKNVDTKK